MKPLRARNQVVVGLVTIALLVLGTLTAFSAKDLPLIGSGNTYSAYFAESAGLEPGNEVQIAGVKVGEVDDVALDGNRVLVKFTVDGREIGDRTRADIQIKTLLGEKFLGLQPAGNEELSEPIPVRSTTSPFDIPDAIDQLTRTTGQLDSAKLAESFRVMSDTMRGAPQHMDQAVNGLSQLSQTIASRDQQLADLLHNASNVSGIVADRDQQVSKLVGDGNRLLSEVQARKQAISGLLVGTENLSNQLRGLVADNQQQMKPALDQLDQLTAMLKRNQDNLDHALGALAPYVRGFNNTIGNGRWFEGYFCGLLPPPIHAGPIQTNTPECDIPVPEGGGR
ncbi:MCE family protein [Saccharopolyspora flava]|uniref:Phospholipid/cholesterol/gamma-HCH transport system substrate-binding protein n=1 Tax=Saccharopolyspora flava TaxID=95161 RepID=A0A1I6RF45_9PSEU|nr:MCE family protein [Saccharopolyspora flava]SFS63200.1 phospholipid/cholesterol/gamma-HCH transport system substrate-binding protein [Saccharopolyspora flava]